MKCFIRDNYNNIIFETDKKEEIDYYIDNHSEYNEFYGFYWENDEMILVTGAYNVIIKGA